VALGGVGEVSMQDDPKQVWADFYVCQAHRAAMDLRWLDRRLSWDSLEALRDAKRWIDQALEIAERLEEEAERGRLDSETS